MSNVVPLLNFAGQAAQAMKLYEKAFGARVIQKLTYALCAGTKPATGCGWIQSLKFPAVLIAVRFWAISHI
jgi:uncharacterized glyoxalase superfamily protein PhnB